MSFQDLDQADQAILASQDLLNSSFSQEIHIEHPYEPNNIEIQPQFSQSQYSHILADLGQTPSQTKLQTRKSLMPQQSGGLFSYLIDNQSKLYDVLQNYLHRLFLLYCLREDNDNYIQQYLDLQSNKRKLDYIQTVYNQVFTTLKNCIQYYQEKVVIITSELDKEDPYSLLTTYEVDLRRALHEFYQFIDSDDPFFSTKGLSQSMTQMKAVNQLETFNPNDIIESDKIAKFILNSLEMEQISIDPEHLFSNKITCNLLKVSQQLIQIWIYLFKFFNQYDITNIQFNFEIDGADLNAAIVAAQSLLFIPQDLHSKIVKQNLKELENYKLTQSSALPLKLIYEGEQSAKKQRKMQSFISFDKPDNILKIAEDALTNENENFSFSDAGHSINDEFSEYQQTMRKYKRSTNQYKQTIIDQATELSFKGRINESHLLDLQPPKHRSFIAEAGQMWKRVIPFIINNIQSDNHKIEISNLDYFTTSNQFLHIFKPQTKTLFLWELDSENIKKLQINVERNFTSSIRSFASQEGHIFVFNPFSSGSDNQFYKYNNDTLMLISLPPMLNKRKNFKVIQQQNYIYVIGGEGEKEEVLSSVERFSLKKVEWQSVRSMKAPLTQVNAVLFQNRYIIRFGGLNRFQHYDKTVERYDTKRHKWQLSKMNCDADIAFNLQSQCVQINSEEILILGGKNCNGFCDCTIQLMDFEINKVHDTYVTNVKQIETQQPILNYMGELDENVYVQNDQIYMLRKNYTSLN